MKERVGFGLCELAIKCLREPISDERGTFVELLRGDLLENSVFGQVSVVTIKPWETRGGHYHTQKWEWFVLLQGDVEMKLKDMTTGEREQVTMEQYQVYMIPPKISHSFRMLGTNVDEAILLVYCDEPYYKDFPDTYRE